MKVSNEFVQKITTFYLLSIFCHQAESFFFFYIFNLNQFTIQLHFLVNSLACSESQFVCFVERYVCIRVYAKISSNYFHGNVKYSESIHCPFNFINILFLILKHFNLCKSNKKKIIKKLRFCSRSLLIHNLYRESLYVLQ